MKSKLLFLVVVAVALLVSFAAEGEAGVSFHPRPKEKSNNRSGSARKSSARRGVYDDVVLQTEEGRTNSAAAQVELPSDLGLRMSEADSKQYGELLVQMITDLLRSGGQEN